MNVELLCVACLCLFAAAFGRKSQNDWSNIDRAHSNTMSKYQDTGYRGNNNIENSEYPDVWEASGDMGYDSMSRDQEMSSGWGDQEDYDRFFNNGHTDSYSGNGKSPYSPSRPKPPGKSGGDKVVQPDPNTPTEPSDIGYDPDNRDKTDVEIKTVPETDEDEAKEPPPPQDDPDHHHRSIIETPGLLPGIIGGAVVGLLCAVLLVMFIVYRMRKKDEGSYALEEPKMTSPSRGYTRAPTKEYWA